MTRSLAEFEPLKPAERKLVDELRTGEPVTISEEVPEGDASSDVRIRASLLQFIVSGNCDACAPGPKGVNLWGAFIEGDLADRSETPGLDFEGCTLTGDLGLFQCRIPDLLLLRSARLNSLFLDGSVLEDGLNAERLQARGNVHLREAQITGELRVMGAELGGELDLSGADLKAGPVGDALNADGLVARGGFFLRDGASVNGLADLSGAHVADLVDDLPCWPEKAGQLLLDGFHYDRITSGSVDAKDRLTWLGKQDPSQYGAAFWPQPYEHLAKVLREMGYRDQAKAVQIERERLQRKAKRKRSAWGPFLWVRDQLLRATVAYGHKPLRAVLWLVLFWGVGAGVFWSAEQQGALKPNEPIILRAQEWTGCFQPDFAKRIGLGQTQYACFLARPEAQSYPRFNPWIYSADTLLPVVDLEMQRYWIPDERLGFGKWARWYLWWQVAVGWALSLLAVAGFSGLIKSD